MKLCLTFVTKNVRVEHYLFQLLKEELNIHYLVNLNNLQNTCMIENLLYKELIYDRYFKYDF